MSNDLSTLREALNYAANIIGSSEPFAKAFSILNAAEQSHEAAIKEAANRFLMWKLPEHFRPDGGISFKATHSENGPWGPQKNEPVGTNLFSKDQAEQMMRHCLESVLYTSKQALSAEPDTVRLDALQQRKVSVNYGESMKYGSGFYWFVPGTKLTNDYAIVDVRQALDEAIVAEAQIKEQG